MPRSLHRFPWPRNLAAISRDPQTLAKLHALLITTGAFNSGDCNGPLIAAYSRIKDLHFAKSPARKISAWNALIIAYSRNNSPDDVLRLFRDLVLQEKPRPDSSTLTIAIKACAQLKDLRTGEMDRALEVFDRMRIRDLVSWTTMITGFSSSVRPVEAIEIYQRIKLENFKGDEVSMVALVQACTNLGDMMLGSSIHGYLMRNYPVLVIVTETALVDMYAKKGLPLHACNLLDRMPRRNLVSRSAFISGLSQNGLAEEALRVLIRMQEEGKLEPDPVALVSSLLSCSQIGLLRQGKTIHGFILRRHDLDRTSCRDSISWNAMISSYGVHGRGREALDLFLQMKNTNLIPDHATFSSLLSALSHCGMVEEGKLWFSLMRSDFGIEPSDEHFACMVDLLARSGFLQEAYELANSMPGDPGIPILVALLSGCRLDTASWRSPAGFMDSSWKTKRIPNTRKSPGSWRN